MTSCNPPAPGIAQVEMVFNLGAQIVENVFHFDLTTGATISSNTLQNLADAAAGAVTTGPWHYCSPNLTFREAIVRDLTPGPGGDVQASTIHQSQGGIATGTDLPNNVALAVALRTTQGGRSGRGRFYAMGLTQGCLATPNTVTGTFAGQLVTGFWAFAAAVIAAAPASHVAVLSRWHNKACRATAVANQISNATANITLDSQRRRLPGRGQ